MADTNTATIEEIASAVDDWFQGQETWGPTLRALAAERDALQAENALLKRALALPIRSQDVEDV